MIYDLEKLPQEVG